MSQSNSRDEAIDLDLVPQLRAIGIEPDEVNLEAIANKTVSSSQSFSHAPTWQNNKTGEALRRIAEQHLRD